MHPSLLPVLSGRMNVLWKCKGIGLGMCRYATGANACGIFLQSCAYMETLFSFRRCCFYEEAGGL